MPKVRAAACPWSSATCSIVMYHAMLRALAKTNPRRKQASKHTNSMPLLAAPLQVKDPSKFAGKKSKATAKAGTATTQWDILAQSDIPTHEIPDFRSACVALVLAGRWLHPRPPTGTPPDLKLVKG